MPTLFRFIATLAVLAALGYGAMIALATFVEPKQGEMTIRIPPERLNPQNQPAPTPAPAPAP
ncbi:MAG: histidine kinase [Methylobacterium mesophilicum]|nr:histidine kinase [Methylobacterium mesophilicum]